MTEAGTEGKKESAVDEARAQRLSVELAGLHCPDCAQTMEKSLCSLRGVASAHVSLMASRVELVVDPGQVTKRKIESRIKSLGYGVRRGTLLSQRHLRATILAGFLAAMGFALDLTLRMPGVYTAPLFGAAIILAGYPIARRGAVAVRRLSLDMNFLMSVAALGAVAIGEWSEGAVAIVLFSVANILESHSMDRTRRAVQALMELAPPEATVRRNGQELKVPVAEVKPGETVLIRPGGRIPLDGEVVSGSSAVNEAPITGESLPVEKFAGERVYGGSVNQSGFLEVKVLTGSEEGTLARIVHLVQEAQARRAPVEGFVDRFARIYTPLVVLGAILTMIVPPLLLGHLWNTWIYRGLVLLVIACPCALVISTPVTIVSALTAAARLGVLVKGGVFLEAAARLKAIAFDKTGTLTYGELRVVGVIPQASASEMDLLRIGASLGALSEHPLSQAVVRRAREMGIEPEEVTDFESLPGLGVRGLIGGRLYSMGSPRLYVETREDQSPVGEMREEGGGTPGLGISVEDAGYTSVVVAGPDGVLGGIEVSDTPREDSAAVLENLRRMGVEHLVMLSGDRPSTARRLGRKIGLSEIRAGLLPEEKVAAVRELREQHEQVAMVGDGVNDAPALAESSLGIAMGMSGTDAALETADVTLVSDDLSRLPRLIALARRASRTVRFNIAFSLATKAVFAALAVQGLATLWMAVFADMGASLIVTFNGMRLLGEVAKRR